MNEDRNERSQTVSDDGADLRLVGLRKTFAGHGPDDGEVVAVDSVDLAFRKGELVTLLGPSGCGKTTLLRMIAGFEEPSAGDVYFGERRVNDLAPNKRHAAMVFQSYAIFPHMTVYENIAFGLRMQRLANAVVRERVDRVVRQVGLEGMTERAPSALSGGQQQRVALARSIVMEPRLLLFDEPLSNLDAKLRDQMRVEIRELQLRLGVTSVYVTHDQVEAMSLSDRVVVMNEGRVEQVGTPVEVYARPANRFVADFIGKANFLEGRAVDAHAIEVAGAHLSVPNGVPHPAGARVTAVVRPEALRIGPKDAGGVDSARGTVVRSAFLGSIGEVVVRVGEGQEWRVDVPNAAEVGVPAAGDEVAVTPSPRSLHVLP